MTPEQQADLVAYERARSWLVSLGQQMKREARDSAGRTWDPTARAKARNAEDMAVILGRLRAYEALADQLAGMTTDDEMGGDMSGDDASSTLSAMIEQARQLSPRRPALD